MPIGVILYLAPLYLSQVLGLTQSQLGRVLWLPPLGWEIGYFFWGWFIDRFATGNSRPAWLVWSLAILGLPLVSVTRFHSEAAVLALLFWSMFIAAGFVVGSLHTSALVYPREQTALVAGIGAGSWSLIVALVLPSLGTMFDRHHYANVFLFTALVPLLGALCWHAPTLPSAPATQPTS